MTGSISTSMAVAGGAIISAWPSRRRRRRFFTRSTMSSGACHWRLNFTAPDSILARSRMLVIKLSSPLRLDQRRLGELAPLRLRQFIVHRTVHRERADDRGQRRLEVVRYRGEQAVCAASRARRARGFPPSCPPTRSSRGWRRPARRWCAGSFRSSGRSTRPPARDRQHAELAGGGGQRLEAPAGRRVGGVRVIALLDLLPALQEDGAVLLGDGGLLRPDLLQTLPDQRRHEHRDLGMQELVELSCSSASASARRAGVQRDLVDLQQRLDAPFVRLRRLRLGIDLGN